MGIDYRLNLVTNNEILQNISLQKAVELAIEGGTTIVQLREKALSTRLFYEQALSIKQVTDYYKVPFIINDRLDIALAINADGLHVGQSDLPAKVARQLLGKEKILGVSASNSELAFKAEQDGADYIGVGAVFPTQSKSDVGYVTHQSLKEICNKVNLPVVAIGGINEGNIEQLKDSNISGIAVISAILENKDIKKATVDIKQKLTYIIK